MHLKKLIISGFKSFADKVSLNFDEGITGIVGPNGSGKSNVIDAVRWVMGEQNAKHLRGQIATDIIFAGSDKRKALGMAEVTLVFDNQDASPYCPAEYRHEPEISLTRRLYVDGEREYMINKKPCRFKDIVSFFANTGLGGRSYSMIQQGQVDRILNAKPEDVREILEEAAGTLVFKARRAEAQKKLEATNENLLRINDIVQELAKQLQTLEGQVAKAKKWQEVSDTLRYKELALFAHNYQHFDAKLRHINEEMGTDTEKEASAMAELAHCEARQEELQGELSARDPELDGLREEIARVREQIVRAESVMSSSIAAIEQGEKRLVEINFEVEEAAESLKALESQVDNATNQLGSARQEAVKLLEMIESFQSEVDRVDEAAQVFRSRIDDLDDEIRNLDKLLESNGLRCEAIERDRKRCLQEIEKFAERMASLEADLSAIGETVERARAQVAERQAGLDKDIFEKQEREQAVSQRMDEIKGLAQQRDKLKEEYMGMRARLQSLEEVEASASDVGAAVQGLRQHASGQDLAFGLLTDYISLATEAGELPRITLNAFEKWVERLVVEDLRGFNRLARAAHEANVGGLNVTVLNEVQAADQAAMAAWAEANDAESFGKYVKVLKTAPGVDALLQKLYHLPVVDLSAQDLAQMPEGLIVFTAAGVLVTERHEFFVGHRHAKGVLSRKSELEDLARRLKTSERGLAETQSALDALEARQHEDRLVIREIEEKLQAQNKNALGLMGELQSATQQYDHKKELLEEARRQHQQAVASEQTFKKELENLGENRIALGSERENVRGEKESLEIEASSVEDEREEVMRQHQQRKMELAKAEARQQALEENFSQTRGQLERLQGSLSRRYEERERIQQDIERTRRADEECRRDIEGFIYLRENLEQQLAERREQNAGLVEELKIIERNLRDMRERQNEIHRQRSKKNVEVERLKLVIQGLVDQTHEKYQLDITKFDFKPEPNFDADAAGKEVQRLRSSLDNMGAINMMAIEEYDKLSKRYTFIESQKEEVVGSIKLLEDAIAEIEETSKDRFLQTFVVINDNFKELFPVLFPGGEARLELTDENDPLNAGVEIMVRLPGKKQQRMNLFSGGEKALTAISLIFALLKTKPTPFCFLDEVDAPLDEANVGRYNKILETLSDRFQFIVITHNRRTMEVLDQLYGVTMEEGGVSKVVGVDMKKDLPAHLQKAFKVENKERVVEGATAQ